MAAIEKLFDTLRANRCLMEQVPRRKAICCFSNRFDENDYLNWKRATMTACTLARNIMWRRSSAAIHRSPPDPREPASGTLVAIWLQFHARMRKSPISS